VRPIELQRTELANLLKVSDVAEPSMNRAESAFGAPDSLGAHTPKKPATL
jgi:hypothetical protein